MKVNVEEKYVIEMTKEEATILCAIVGNIGGYNEKYPEIRKFTDELFPHLYHAIGDEERYKTMSSLISGRVKGE